MQITGIRTAVHSPVENKNMEMLRNIKEGEKQQPLDTYAPLELELTVAHDHMGQMLPHLTYTDQTVTWLCVCLCVCVLYQL